MYALFRAPFVLFSNQLQRIFLYLDILLSIFIIIRHLLLNLAYVSKNVTYLVFVQQECQLLHICIIFVMVDFNELFLTISLYPGIPDIFLFRRFHIFFFLLIYPLGNKFIFDNSVVVFDDVSEEVAAFSHEQETETFLLFYLVCFEFFILLSNAFFYLSVITFDDGSSK